MLRESSKISLLGVLFSLLLTSQAGAIDDPYMLLPRNHEVGSWVQDGPEAYYYDFSLERILDDRVVQVVDDYSLINLLSQYYVLDMTPVEIRIFTMTSPEQAYGLYSVFGDIEPDAKGSEIVIQDENRTIARTVTKEMRVLSDSEIHLLGDNHFIQIVAGDESHNIDLLFFTKRIQSKFDVVGAGIEGTKPLDDEDKIFGSVRLIGGYDSLGLYFPVGHFDPFLLDEEDVRCLQADYRLKPGKMYRQLVFEYSDVETAKTAYLRFTEWTEDFSYLRRINYVDSLGSVVAEDEDERYIAGFRDGKYLRVFHGFEDTDELKTALARYVKRR